MNLFGQSDYVRRTAATSAIRALESVGWSLTSARECLTPDQGITDIKLVYGRSDQEHQERTAFLTITFARGLDA